MEQGHLEKSVSSDVVVSSMCELLPVKYNILLLFTSRGLTAVQRIGDHGMLSQFRKLQHPTFSFMTCKP